jgi:hypothetical protein
MSHPLLSWAPFKTLLALNLALNLAAQKPFNGRDGPALTFDGAQA